jgi:hypothetical protein
MSQYTFRFMINQADEGVVYAQGESENPAAPGNLACWSSPSFKLGDSDAIADLAEDGGHWVGTVQFLAKDVVNMIATYFPVKGAPDNIQLTGPILFEHGESSIAIVGGGGKFAGARGEARCVIGMSDLNVPLYRYTLQFSA